MKKHNEKTQKSSSFADDLPKVHSYYNSFCKMFRFHSRSSNFLLFFPFLVSLKSSVPLIFRSLFFIYLFKIISIGISINPEVILTSVNRWRRFHSALWALSLLVNTNMLFRTQKRFRPPWQQHTCIGWFLWRLLPYWGQVSSFFFIIL